MFTSSFIEKNQDEICIDPESQVIGSSESVELALEFLYTRNMSPAPNSITLIMEVCQVAELWLVGQLKQLCEYLLSANLNIETCENLLRFAKENDCGFLHDCSLRFILSNMDEIAISNRGLFKTDSLLFEELRSLQQTLPMGDEGRTMLAFKKTKIDQYIYSGYLAKLKFPFASEAPLPIGIVIRMIGSQVEVTDLKIRLPTYIDRKMFDLSYGCPQDIIRSKIVSYAAIDNDIYFGISNNNRFSGVLKYNILFQTWDILPFIPGTIEAKMTKTRTEHVTFFVKETREEKKLMVMNIQKNQFAFHESLLIIRSLEDGALVVDREIAKVNIPSGSLFYSESPNVVQVREELFFVFKQELLVLDAEGMFHCITPRDTDIFSPALEDFRLIAVPVVEFGELVVIVQVKYTEGQGVDRFAWSTEGCQYRLNIFKYNLKRGYVSIPQPPNIPCGSEVVTAFYYNDSVNILGCEVTGERFMLTYNVMLKSWSKDTKCTYNPSEEDYYYTSFYPVSGAQSNLFWQS